MSATTPLIKKSSRGMLPPFVTLIVGFAAGILIANLFSDLSRPALPEWVLTTKPMTKNTKFMKEFIKKIHNHNHTYENTKIADKLHKEVRVLCWIMTNPDNHETKARHVKETWGKRCNKLLFMSSAEDTELGTIALPIGEGRDNLWGKTKEAFKYIYKHHIDDADWFLKADDDTYTIVENLRYMLYPYTPETPIYFGCRFQPYVKQGYMSGGAGYVLSKEAVRRFVTEAIPQPWLCKKDNTGAEDVEIGKCLENVKVLAGDSRDSHGLGKFFPLGPQDHLIPKRTVDWYWTYNFYKNNMTDSGCCSDDSISFHYLSPDEMYTMEFLIYHLQPYGIFKTPEPLPKRKTLVEAIPTEMISNNASTYVAINSV